MEQLCDCSRAGIRHLKGKKNLISLWGQINIFVLNLKKFLEIESHNLKA